MQNKLGKKFWLALVLFGLIGQVAWVVENMYFNVFIYKMFHASAADISLMVAASAVAATVTTILMGALSDRIGKRKILICGGYLVWGVSILAFAFVRMDVLTPLCGSAVEAAALGVSLTIILDCVMTFFGSTANDAAYNAWLTDAGDDSNRGKIEGINAMMPLVAILVVFGGFMGFDLDKAESWTSIYLIIGGVVLVIGIAGFFLIQEAPSVKQSDSYWGSLIYSFRPSVIKGSLLLYAIIGAFAIFNISIQIFMPYLILYYEQSLQMANYVLVMAPAIILASVATVFYGRLFDKLGFMKSVIPCLVMLVAGYVILYFTVSTVPVFIGSLLMMCGYLCGMAIFGAMIRQNIPQQMAGRFQGIRIIGQVLIPGVIGPAIGAWVLRDAPQIENQDGTFSFLPDTSIWVAATLAAVVLAVVLYLISVMIRRGHYDLSTDDSENPDWDIHPNPRMKRDSWAVLDDWMLNGRLISVPFPPQAPLSDYQGKIGTELTYETTFDLPSDFTGARTLLHFGAVDQTAEVWINGSLAGSHEGGYLPFTFDITQWVKKADNHLVVKAADRLDRTYPYGKQCSKRGGMWYTPVSGIWQTVWLENVPADYIKNITVTPDLTGVDIAVEGVSSFTVTLNGKEYPFDSNSGRIEVEIPRLWTPEDPHLYPITVTAGEDKVESYFALRTVSVGEKEGVNRVCLNGRPIFLHGVLDQGYFPDGLFLPARPEEYRRDILRMKELGFNLLRKHIKVEPELFYYACDRLGMLVMQDMVNSGSYSFWRDTALPTVGMKTRKDTGKTDDKRRAFFRSHTEATVRHLYSHPSVIAWTIFNEGWGQFDSDNLYDRVKQLDPTRLIDSTSGWFSQQKNDFDSEHIYFDVRQLTPGSRPLLVSECGGYSRLVDGHYYSKYSTYGYGSAETAEELTEKIVAMYEGMILPAIPNGCCGCVYTQLSDVEDEVNGLYTYDRKVCKVDKEAMRALAARLKAL